MRYSLITIVILLLSLFTEKVYCQDNVAIKTNLLYGAGAFTPNVGIEIGLGRQTTLDVSGGYNWFNIKGARNSNKKLVHWIVQPEFRYFLCERFNGHFFGFHGLFSQYNIGSHKLPMLFGKDSKNFRYHGDAFGCGISYGYQLLLSRRWNLEFNVGAGYARMKYDKYDNINCGKFIEKDFKDYFGLTKAGITLIFLIN